MRKYYHKDLRGHFWYRLRKYRKTFFSYFTNLYMHIICFLKGVSLGNNVKFVGNAFIVKHPSSLIKIGNRCFFRSARWATPHSIGNRSSIVTLRKEAEIIMGENVGGTAVTITAAKKIEVGDNVLFGVNTFIMDTDWHDPDPQKRMQSPPAKPVKICNNVFLGANSIVLKGVTIGENTIIGANSVVYSNIPPNCFAAGNPCKVILKRNWSADKKNEQ